MVTTIYDEDYRKRSVTPSAAYGTESATTSYSYDRVGNLISVLTPDEQPGQVNAGRSTVSVYDERNRPISVTDALNHLTSFSYDQGGRRKTVTQPNGQIITFNLYDSMNRLLQQTVKQTPSPDAVTKYTYDPSGLQVTMQDPGLVAHNSVYKYIYEYDPMGRKKSVTYPPAADGGTATTEVLAYDPSGHLYTFTNRGSNIQTFSYDALNRPTGFSWSDRGVTPTVAFGYDVAGRMISITNANAAIWREYFNDNLLKSESETAAGGSPNPVVYDYNADGLRGNIIYPSGKSYSYGYTGRNDLWYVKDNSASYQVSYLYGENGNVNLTKRYVGSSSIMTDLSQRDGMNRVTHLEHRLIGTTRTLDYQYNAMGGITSLQRDGGTADTYYYDLAQQLISTVLGNATTDLTFDANGNRTYGWCATAPPPCDPNEGCYPVDNSFGGSYGVNNLNQYTLAPPTAFGGSNPAVAYDQKGNLSTFGARTYVFDAQNRLIKVKEGTATVAQYSYDGLNRQITRTLNGATTYHVWDGWNLIEERGPGNALQNAYLYGTGEIVENVTTQKFYFQEASGSTSHLSDAAGNLLEKYTYSGFGQPNFYNAAGGGINGSNYGVRHLFQGELWTQQTGLNDHRNRQALPALGTFLQPDPIGFDGDATNLYRYCGNNSLNGNDPMGTDTWYGNRLLGSPTAAPPLSNNPFNSFTHTFVYTTNANGTLNNTYSWGTNSLLSGTWAQNYSQDRTAAATLIQAGAGSWQGPASFDKYVQQAFNILSQNPGHINLLDFYNCKQEAIALIAIARYLQSVDQGLIMGFTSLSSEEGSGQQGGGKPFDYVGYSLTNAVAGAIAALNAYGQSHGPGIGIVTARSSTGTEILAAGFVGGGGFAAGQGFGAFDGSFASSGNANFDGRFGGASAGMDAYRQSLKLN